MSGRLERSAGSLDHLSVVGGVEVGGVGEVLLGVVGWRICWMMMEMEEGAVVGVVL